MDKAISKLFKERYPELERLKNDKDIEVLKVLTKTQIGEKEMMEKKRNIFKGFITSRGDEKLFQTFAALRSKMATHGVTEIACPVIQGVQLDRMRKIAEVAFYGATVTFKIHTPHNRSVKGQMKQPKVTGAIIYEKKARNTDAVFVTVGERAYCEVLKEVRKAIMGKPEAEMIKGVRKTKDDRLLIVVRSGKNPTDISKVINSKIGGADAKVGEKSGSKTKLTIRGMESVTTLEEVREAIKREIKGGSDIQMELGDLRETFGQGKAVILTVDKSITNELVQKAWVKIGLNQCKIKEWIRLRKCFKCWETGHTANNCTGVDRTGRCHKCNMEGHTAKDCNNSSFCPLCEMKGHMAATGKCPKFRNALNQARLAKKLRAKRKSEGEAEGGGPIDD